MSPITTSPASSQRYYSHRAAELDAACLGHDVRVAGWVHRIRELGSLIFLEIRDNSGVVQCVVEACASCFERVRGLRQESVVSLSGELVLRQPGANNPSLVSGEFEIRVAELELLSPAEPLPFPVHDETAVPEELRLKYRYLDLRRERVRRNVLLRSRVIARLRELMAAAGFVEFQTPILTASSPEGARDFLVPSRLHPGKCYALPQAPQIFKQLLMVSGFDRYFQIAPCFRDEDARADRSPGEFYQLDIELAFVTQDEIFASMEPVLHAVFSELGRYPTPAPPFPRIPYREALLRYASDKPDLRNALAFACLPPPLAARLSELGLPFTGDVRLLRAPQGARLSRRFFDQRAAAAARQGAQLGWLALADNVRGSLARLPEDVRGALAAAAGAALGDAVFLVGVPQGKLRAAAKLRVATGLELGVVHEDSYRFCWITDFPMYERNAETGAIEFSHNPFSMPQGGLPALDADPLSILAHQYDIVCNGIELSSGALRNHRPDIMLKAFAIAGYPASEVEARFGGLLRAFRHGAPPHGGLAPGIDRMLMLLAGEPNLREVIAFPFSQSAQDLMLGAPSSVTPAQRRELHFDWSEEVAP